LAPSLDDSRERHHSMRAVDAARRAPPCSWTSSRFDGCWLARGDSRLAAVRGGLLVLGSV